MQNNKAPGPGGLPVELYKFAPNVVVVKQQNYVTNYLIKGEETPSQWRGFHISSIYKKGNKKVN